MQVEFDQTTSRFTFGAEDNSGIQIRSCMAWARYHLANGELSNQPLNSLGASIQEHEISDVHGDGGEWVLHCPINQDGTQLTYFIKHYLNHPFIFLRISIQNHRSESIYLQDLCLFQASPSNTGQVQLKASREGHRFLKIGWHGWDDSNLRSDDERNSRSWLDKLTRLSYSNPVTKRPSVPGEFCSEGWSILIGSESAVITGLVSTAHQFGQVYASLRPGHEALMLLTQLDDARLNPGETCFSEWGYLQFISLPNSSPQAEYLAAVAREMQARVPATPPLPMWTHWYQFYHEISEEVFLNNLEELAEKRKVIPIQVAELDDGYQAAWGDWTATNPKFPHGLKWLAQEIRSMGFIPGLWLAPFAIQAKSKLAQERPDWLVKDKKGRPSKAGFLYNMFIHALDLTHPEVLEHLKQLAYTLTQEWGFEMLKVDFLNAAALPGGRYNPGLTRAEALRLGLEAIRKGAGESAFLLGCGCPFGPAIGVVDAMRIGPDTAPSWEPNFHWLGWASPLIRGNPSVPALRNALRNTLVLDSLNRKWWWNDPDCLLVRDENTRLTSHEVQSAVSLVGLSGGMLVSSDDLRKVPSGRLRWLSLLTPNLGLEGHVLDLLENSMPGLYVVKVEQGGQGWQLAALFNWSDQPADCALCFADLGYQDGVHKHVFDFWEGKYQQVSQPKVVFRQVPAHGCKLLRICQAGNNPQLVGSTLHISQGLELSSMRVVEGKLVIESINLNRQVEGELWLALDHPPIEAHCNGQRLEIHKIEEGVYGIHLGFMGLAKIVIRLDQ
jgi:alpha-galactosidase